MFNCFNDDGPHWFGHDWPPPWFVLACAGLLLVLIFMWLMGHAGY